MAGDMAGDLPGEMTGALDAVREQRCDRPATRLPGELPTLAIVADRPTDTLPPLLTRAGWRVTGLLTADVFDGLLWASRTPGVARSYVELAELLLDPTADAVCLDLDASAGPTLDAVLHAGLHVLLPRPVDLDTEAVRRALATAEESGAEHAVVLLERWRRSFATVTALRDSGELGVPRQLTVRGWPTGPGATVELVDLVTRWAGDVVAACAAPGRLPAAELPGGHPVRWALLTELGCTVLVAPGGAPEPLLRLSCPQGRLEATPSTLAWAGGGAVPLLAGSSDPVDNQVEALLATAGPLAATALHGAAGPPDPVEAARVWPWPATLRDLFVGATVRESLRTSAVEGRWVETG